MKVIKSLPFFLISFIYCIASDAQQCKTTGSAPVVRYDGDCSEGLANGKGISFYSDSSFYSGKFEKGKREGKGEMHFKRKNQVDSIIKGYWSGDIYQGKRYDQYRCDDYRAVPGCRFDFLGSQINMLTIQIDLTRDGNYNDVVLSSAYAKLQKLINLEVLGDPLEIKQINNEETPAKVQYIYAVEKFPVKLKAHFSNGNDMVFQLNRQGSWKISGYLISRVETRIEARTIRKP